MLGDERVASWFRRLRNKRRERTSFPMEAVDEDAGTDMMGEKKDKGGWDRMKGSGGRGSREM